MTNLSINTIYYYHHIPKVGGTSLARLISNIFSGYKSTSFYADFPNQDLVLPDSIFINGGHWGEFGRSLLVTQNEMKYIVMLREPISRCVSEYNFLHQEGSINNIKISPIQKKIINADSFLDAINLCPAYFSDFQTRFLGGDFFLDDSWSIASKDRKEEVLKKAKKVVDDSLLLVAERFNQSAYHFMQHFGLLPFRGFMERLNTTKLEFKKNLTHNTFETLKEINLYDAALYSHALAKMDSLNILEGPLINESMERLRIGRTSKEVPTINGDFNYPFRFGLLADGISYIENLQGRFVYWVVDEGSFIFWGKFLNKKTRVCIRYSDAISTPKHVKINGKNSLFQLHLNYRNDVFTSGFIMFEVTGKLDKVIEIEIGFEPGIKRNDNDPRTLSALILGIGCIKI